jgi:hypothetical protein
MKEQEKNFKIVMIEDVNEFSKEEMASIVGGTNPPSDWCFCIFLNRNGASREQEPAQQQ